MRCGLTPHLEHTLPSIGARGAAAVARLQGWQGPHESFEETDVEGLRCWESLARQEVIMNNVHRLRLGDLELWVLTTAVWLLIALAYCFVR